MEPEVAPSLAEGSFSQSPRPSAAANLRIALDERASWIANAATQISPPRTTLAPGEVHLPLRLVVHRCLDDWGIDSDSSEDEDDFCGWRVGSRAELPPDRTRAAEQAMSSSARPPVGGFGFAVRGPAGSSSKASASAAVSGTPAAAPERCSSSSAVLSEELRSFCALGVSFSSGRPPGALPASERPSSGTKCLLM